MAGLGRFSKYLGNDITERANLSRKAEIKRTIGPQPFGGWQRTPDVRGIPPSRFLHDPRPWPLLG